MHRPYPTSTKWRYCGGMARMQLTPFRSAAAPTVWLLTGRTSGPWVGPRILCPKYESMMARFWERFPLVMFRDMRRLMGLIFALLGTYHYWSVTST